MVRFLETILNIKELHNGNLLELNLNLDWNIFFIGITFITTIYIIKELVQPKMSLNREFLIWKERGRGWEREGLACWQVSRQAYLRLG
jgi:hypothetical protein